MACDRGRKTDISGDPAAHASAPAPAPAPSPADAAPADAARDGAVEEPPIEIRPSIAAPTTVTIQVAFGDVDALAKAVAEPFGVCYHDALARDPMLAGVLVVRFVILSNGRVDAPAAGGKTLRDPEL